MKRKRPTNRKSDSSDAFPARRACQTDGSVAGSFVRFDFSLVVFLVGFILACPNVPELLGGDDRDPAVAAVAARSSNLQDALHDAIGVLVLNGDDEVDFRQEINRVFSPVE